MSTKAQTKDYVFTITNISTGSLVPNVSAGFSVLIVNDGVGSWASPNISSISGAPGYYICSQNAGAGTGAVIVQNISAGYQIKAAPITFDDNLADTDTINGRLLSSGTSSYNPSLIQTTGPFGAYTGTDFVELITIPTTLVGPEYGGDSATLTGWSTTVGSTTPFISGGTATISDPTNRVVTIQIARALLTPALFTGGQTSVSFPMDVVGHSPTSLRRVLARFTLNLSLGVDSND